MKNLIVLILCVVCGATATSSETLQISKEEAAKEQAVQQFSDKTEAALSRYNECKQSAGATDANQYDKCQEIFTKEFQINVDELKSVLTTEDIAELNEVLRQEGLNILF